LSLGGGGGDGGLEIGKVSGGRIGYEKKLWRRRFKNKVKLVMRSSKIHRYKQMSVFPFILTKSIFFFNILFDSHTEL